MIIMKFGGAALARAANILITSQIIKKYSAEAKLVIVVSAMKGITDKLTEVVNCLNNRQIKKGLIILANIKNIHLSTGKSLNVSVKTQFRIKLLLNNLGRFIINNRNKKITADKIDYILSFGERLSCLIISNTLKLQDIIVCPIDASQLLATDGKFGKAKPLNYKKQESIKKMLQTLIENNITPIVTGFIGYAPDGRITTLGRGGSDLTAAYLANLLNADALYFWKDVDGFYVDDPKKNSQSLMFNNLSYKKAEILTKNGAKILHHQTISHIEKNNIPIYIKNFLNPKATGTLITE
ncbi:MAG: aspartate kinase [Candidatus Roizmanbacteria bacterium]|nr:MAG: aspartate kinase [Candidatus Roizmanbacteria bacterium]